MTTPPIQWYPGHIAKAEKALKEQPVDVVLEVRDARIPIATHHPQVAEWVGSKAGIGAEPGGYDCPKRSNCG